MAEAPDPFGDAIVDETPRDRYGRPKLISLRDDVPKDKDGRTAYTRASTLASYIENDAHITRWKMRYLARGIAWNPDLAALAGMETYNTRIGMPDRDPENSASGKRLDKVIDQALDRMYISEKADYGTVVHVATEPDYEGFIQDRMKADVDSFNAKLLECGIKIVGTELFTANDVTMSAGTFDHLMWVPGYGFVVTDKKTSAKVDGPHFAIQVASYSYAELYDVKTDERTPMESLTGGEEINRKVGLIFWIKNGKTEIHELDLELGWEGAQIAAGVRDYNQKKHPGRVDDKIKAAADEARQEIFKKIDVLGSPGAVRSLYPRYKHLWVPEHTAAAKRRVAELEAS